MKQIAKRIIAGVLFFSIFIVAIMYAGLIGRPYYNGSYNYNIWQYFYEEDDNTHNVVSIASSAMYRYWVPTLAYSEYGFTSFTIGSTRLPFGTVPYIIEEIMKTQTPDVIVVEVRSLLNQRIYEVEGHEDGQADMQSWLLDIIASGMNYSSTRFNMIHDSYVDTEGDCELYWHIPILKHHSLEYSLPLDERIDRIFASKDPYKSTYLHSGVEILNGQSAEKELLGEYCLTDADKAAIDKAVEKAAEYDFELLFIATPYHLDKNDASMLKSFQDYAEEKNYPYVDFNDYVDEIGLDNETDFYNDIHTNIVGAEKFTRYFSQYLVDNYELDNVKLTDAQTAEWEQTCKLWDEKSNVLKKEWEANCIAAKNNSQASQDKSDLTE